MTKSKPPQLPEASLLTHIGELARKYSKEDSRGELEGELMILITHAQRISHSQFLHSQEQELRAVIEEGWEKAHDEDLKNTLREYKAEFLNKIEVVEDRWLRKPHTGKDGFWIVANLIDDITSIVKESVANSEAKPKPTDRQKGE